MNIRSTNDRFTHFGGDVWSNVESSHGVQLTGGSTGGIIEPVGDDANITLRVRGKGTGGVLLGNSSSPLTIAAGVPVKGFYSQNSTFSFGVIPPSRSTEITLASTTVDINTGDLLSIGLVIDTANLSSAATIDGFRLSTVATSRLTIIVGNAHSTATSTGSGTFQLAWIDLS
jgi:hypothetical protein